MGSPGKHPFNGEKSEGEVSNAFRAECAAAGLAAWSMTKGEPDDDPECGLVDFLADLMHYCDREQLDFLKAYATASMHYVEER